MRKFWATASVILSIISVSGCSNSNYKFFSELGEKEQSRVTEQAKLWASQHCSSARQRACVNQYINQRDSAVAMGRLYNTMWNEMTYPRQFMAAQMQSQCSGNQQCVMANLQARDAQIINARKRAVEQQQALNSIYQSVNDLTNQLNAQTQQMRQNSYQYQSQPLQIYRPSTVTCVNSGIVTQCR